ncbi:hypothetical protein CLLI_27420 [Clostridium liquoris]|uniref:Oligosaccharide repeat unit polymerase n=1 Tax=Clostridium liquoris TaxID=1289519 RepID=A0A2T0AZX2_9CLOT|nr:O-antigen polymerase [Clostridium liquoris]PRR76812.1 hypothetical protein CLLI_27420 [Clostridium liquoris]
MVNLFIVLIVLAISIFLFKKASGTLAPNKLNMISYIFYLFIVQTYIGASLIFLGLRKHYLVEKILNPSTIDKTYYMVAYTAIMFPLVMYLTAKLIKVDIGKSYNDYLKKNIEVIDEKYEFITVLTVCIICIFSVIYMFIKIGYVPFIDLVLHNDPHRFMTKRIELTNNFPGNQYIKNIIAMNFTPILSYITFVYAKNTKKAKWIILFLIMFVCTVFVKTYNYSKSPLAFYIFGFVFLLIITSKGISKKNLIKVFIASIAVIVVMYLKIGYYFNSGLHIYSGPLGRIFYTQVATLFLHVDLFPAFLPFLHGKSLYPTILHLLGSNETYVRSGKIVMDFYNPEGVFNGVAGVMNTIFIGEAYANFGMIGTIIAPIYVGIVCQLVFILFLKMKKTPINIGFFVSIILTFGTMSQAGFTDFIYNSTVISVFLLLLAMNIIINLFKRIAK